MTGEQIKNSIIQTGNVVRWETDLAVSDNRRLRPGRGRWIPGEKYGKHMADQKLLLSNRIRQGLKGPVEVLIQLPRDAHDVGAFAKWILDAMSGSVYIDDYQVDDYRVKRVEGLDRVIVQVREIEISRRGIDSLQNNLVTAAAS